MGKTELNREELIITRFMSVNGIVEEERMALLLEQRPTFTGNGCSDLLASLKAEGLIECSSGQCWLSETGSLALRQTIQVHLKDMLTFLEEKIMPPFKELDAELKYTCLRWQVMPDGGPNTHDDSLYDFNVLERLGNVHRRLIALIGSNAQVLHFCVDILADLNIAIDKIDNGQFDYVSGVNVNSYHNIWREMHEQLLNALGMERTE